MEKIRGEIQEVVAKYCVVQEDDVRFDLYNDDDDGGVRDLPVARHAGARAAWRSRWVAVAR